MEPSPPKSHGRPLQAVFGCFIPVSVPGPQRGTRLQQRRWRQRLVDRFPQWRRRQRHQPHWSRSQSPNTLVPQMSRSPSQSSCPSQPSKPQQLDGPWEDSHHDQQQRNHCPQMTAHDTGSGSALRDPYPSLNGLRQSRVVSSQPVGTTHLYLRLSDLPPTSTYNEIVQILGCIPSKENPIYIPSPDESPTDIVKSLAPSATGRGWVATVRFRPSYAPHNLSGNSQQLTGQVPFNGSSILYDTDFHFLTPLSAPDDINRTNAV